MPDSKKSDSTEARLDRIGRILIRASRQDDNELEAIASSPFLYTRVAGRIRAERQEAEEGRRAGYESWLFALWRAVPAMCLASALALGAFVIVSSRTYLDTFNTDIIFGVNDTQIGRVAFTDQRPLTNDDVLSAIINSDEQENAR